MLKTIFWWVIALIILALLFLWAISGGPAAVARTAGHIGSNPIGFLFGNGTSTPRFSLPWQPAMPHGPDISAYVNQANQLQQSGQQDQGQQSAPYAGMSPSEARTFGYPSPYRGEVTLSRGGAGASSPDAEYLVLQATGNISPIIITGWSVQSAVSGVRVPIPQGAPDFILGVVNNVEPVSLVPGGTAYLTTGSSPVGVSFRENPCSGYLQLIRNFTPPIQLQCPTPSEMLPMTAANIRKYGNSCLDYVGSLGTCAYVGNNIPSGLSPNCQAFLKNSLTYNGCLNAPNLQNDGSYDTWRLYLNQSHELWNNHHDVLRLLDAQGRTVDVLSY